MPILRNDPNRKTMRFSLTLRNPAPGSSIPLNYAYKISAWIYQAIGRSDEAFSEQLHESGFGAEGRQFRLFNFSALRVPERRVEGDRLLLLSPRLYLTVSFCAGPSAEHFLTGLFRRERLEIADAGGRVLLPVEELRLEPLPDFSQPLRLRSLSPVCVSLPEQRGARSIARYLSPLEEGYGARLLENLRQKYQAAAAQLEGYPPLGPEAGPPWAFRLLSEPRSRLITIAAGSSRETRVRGYDFACELQGPEALLRLMHFAGLGEKNSMGFGCMGVQEERR
jgi:CRISPR-associated endoribonuclease Cas6